MTFRSIADRAREIVTHTLGTEEAPEVDRLLVAGALVSRDGSHYRIESGGETAEDLAAIADQSSGRCDCGGLLSAIDTRSHCRSCGREYEVA